MAEGDLGLHRSFFGKPYTNMYLMHGSTHRTRALENETLQRAAVRNQIFVQWLNLQRFAVSEKGRYHHYESVRAFRQN